MVIADGGRCGNSKHLIERADAARQGDKHVALVHHQLLAVGQVIARYLYLYVIAGASRFFYLGRHHTDGTAASRFGSLGHTLHQALVNTAIHDAMTTLSRPLAKLGRKRKKLGINLLVGRTKHTYFHNACKITNYFVSLQTIIDNYTKLLCENYFYHWQ